MLPSIVSLQKIQASHSEAENETTMRCHGLCNKNELDEYEHLSFGRLCTLRNPTYRVRMAAFSFQEYHTTLEYVESANEPLVIGM